MYLIRILFLLLLISPQLIADVVFKSTAEVDLYASIEELQEQSGHWPSQTLFTGNAISDNWIKVSGVFQNNQWIVIETDLYAQQSNNLIVASDIKTEQDLTRQKIAVLSQYDDVGKDKKLSLEQWQQKQYFKRWVDGIHHELYIPPHLIEEQVQHTPKTKVNRLTDIAANNSLKLNGNKSSIEFSFGTRLDKAVKYAELDLQYMYSPALVDIQSQVKVYLNDEVINVLSVPAKQAGDIVQKKIQLPVHQFRDFNRIKFELFGYYQTMNGQCYDPSHLSLWFELLSSSKLTLKEVHLPLKNDLSLLPAPFFDERMMEKQTVSIVLPKNMTAEVAQAAAITSSWLGAEAQWRGSKFEVFHDQLPDQHAIVFATNENKPTFLQDYPEVKSPTVVMASHPYHNDLKLLLVLGKDEEQLLTAAKGLSIGHENLSGQAAEIRPAKFVKKLNPYQAPLWVNNERPMKLSELVNDESELRREGAYISPISVNLHIPADLFIWETKGVPVDLSYRYTPPNDPSQSMLNVKVNSKLVESFKLDDKGVWDGGNRIRMPFTDQTFSMSSDLLLPSFQLGIQNVMEFDFLLQESNKACVSEPPNKFVQIDYNSTMDFSGFQHYAEMPNLSSLAYSGLPFTRLADLSETLIILPTNFGVYEANVLFTMLARFSAVTGYPANMMEIVLAGQEFDPNGKDIIYLNAFSEKDLEQLELDAIVDANLHTLSLTRDLFKDSHLSQRRFIDEAKDQPYVFIQHEFDGDVAMISEFESPYSKGRSVLSVMAGKPSSLELVSNLFEDGEAAYQMKGAVLLLHDNKIRYSTVGEKYYTGKLPVWIMTRYHLSQYPTLLLSAVFIILFLLTLLAWRTLKYFAYKRVNDE